MTNNQFYGVGASAPLKTAVNTAIAVAAFTGVGTEGNPNKIRPVTLDEVKSDVLHPVKALTKPQQPGQSDAAYATACISTGARIGLIFGLIIFGLILISCL